MTVIHLHVTRPTRAYPSHVKQCAVAVLWNYGFDVDKTAAALSVHPEQVVAVLDLLRGAGVPLRPVPLGAMR
jgi:hypothetical protein